MNNNSIILMQYSVPYFARISSRWTNHESI